MGSIPLPALDVRTQQPDMMGDVSKLMALKQMMGQQQIQQQTIQANALENQQRQQKVKDQKTVTDLYVKNNGDLDKTIADAAKSGVTPETLQALQLHSIDVKGKTLDLVTKQGALAKQHADMMLGAHDTVSAAEAKDRPAVYQQQLVGLKNAGIDVSQMPPEYPGDEAFKILGAFVQGHSQQIEQATKQSETAKNAAQAAEANAVTDKTKLETQLMQQYGTPQQQEAKYVALQTQKNQGQPLNPPDAAFVKSYEHLKTLVPTANFNLQNAGVTGTPGQPSAIAKGLADGSMKWQDVVSARTPMAVKQSLLAEVKGIKPDFNSGDFDVEQAVKRQATSGAVGQSLLAIGTAREHMKTFSALADALDNNDVQALNKLGNAIGVQFGSDKKTNFQIAAQAFGGEVGRAFDGAGVIGAEREQAQNNFNAAMSKGQFKGAIQTVDALLAGKQKAAHEWFDKGTQGKPDFGDRPPVAPSGKSVSLAAARQLPQNKGKTDDQIKADIEQYGHTVVP